MKNVPFLLKLPTSYNTQISTAFGLPHIWLLHLYFLSFCHSQIFYPLTLFPYFSFNLNQTDSSSITSLILLSLTGELVTFPWFSERLIYPSRSLLYCSAGHSSAAQQRMQQDSYLSPILYLVDGKLHRNVEAVQNIASEHQRVLWSINSMDPTLITKRHTEIRNI